VGSNSDFGAVDRRACAGAESQTESGGGEIVGEEFSVPDARAEPDAESTAQGNSEVGRLADAHGGAPEVSARRTVESEPMPATWIVFGFDVVTSAARSSRIGRSWLGRSLGGLGGGDGVNADRPPSGADIVDRPVSPDRPWNLGAATDGRSAGLGCSGAKNSSSGSGGPPSAAAASR
jgi:hypothetical protein